MQNKTIMIYTLKGDTYVKSQMIVQFQTEM